MPERLVLQVLLIGLLTACATPTDQSKGQEPAPSVAQSGGFSVVEASFADMQRAMSSGETSSREIVQQYLDRIHQYDDVLRATLAVNPNALKEAARLDAERAHGNVRGPLHGVPIALKDNIHTISMPTTGGALAFEGYTPPYEATLVTRLRDAGAIIIAKTTLTELANWVATGMPNSYNPIVGYGMNPYDPRPDPRPGFDDGRAVMDPGGSSSGIGTSANLWAANVGTETSGSIEIPANNTMLAAIKPTVGRISRYGIIPITADQDTAGPMAKYVADAAALLGAMEGTDPHDRSTGVCPPPADPTYSDRLKTNGLSGARIGVPRAFFYDPVIAPGADAPAGGLTAAQSQVMAKAISLLKAQGAVVVDPANLPSTTAPNADDNQLLFGNCYDVAQGKGGDQNCSVVMKYGMKRDFNRWLASLGDSAPIGSLTELREFNLENRDRNAIRYDQAQLDISDQMDVVADRERWRKDRRKDLRLSRTEGIDAALEANDLDALLVPAWRAENIVNKAGYPVIVVPFAFVPNALEPPLPDDFDPQRIPFGVSFVGTACSEPRLIELAYSFEQATRARRPPPATP